MLQIQPNEFRRPFSVDFAPKGSLCEWCDQPAEKQLTAIGGMHHNHTGIFCQECAEHFMQILQEKFTLSPVAPEEMY